jgi:hypothetical protein
MPPRVPDVFVPITIGDKIVYLELPERALGIATIVAIIRQNRVGTAKFIN